MQSVLQNLGMTQQEFVEQNPFENNDEYEYDDSLENVDRYYDMHDTEIKDKERFIRKKKIIKKYFPEPKETNLLTAFAKQQIKYLYKLDPIEWDAYKLSQSFPISFKGVKKLLRNNYTIKSKKQQYEHDTKVATNIKLLKKGDPKISPVTRKLWEEGHLKIEYSSGNVNFPNPIEDKDVKIEKPTEKSGEFLCIVKPYLDLKEKQLTVKNPENTTEKTQPELKENLIQLNREISGTTNRQFDDDDLRCASSFNSFHRDDEPDITLEELQKNMTKENNSIDTRRNNKENIQEKVNETDIFPTKNVPKYKTETLPIVLDSYRNKNSEETQPYLYDEKTGYEHPLGELSEYPEKINIPKHLVKSGAIYKVNNCYYDENGNFLYRSFI